jgi:acyl-CoA synthetase (AMP-forming)/AMP-acid ligase II
MNLTGFLRLDGTKYPDKVGYVFEDVPYTYQEVMLNSAKLAAHLRREGIREGDKVCTFFYNGIECVYAYFGALMLGAVVVPVNFRYAGPEISYVVNHSDAKAILYGEEFQPIIAEIKTQLPHIEWSLLLNKKDEIFAVAGQYEDFAQLLENGPDMDRDSFILYTSGTTGKPKGVVVTHSGNIWNQFNIIVDSPLSRNDVMINPMPLFHAGALGRFMAMTMVGGTFLTWKTFDAQKVMQAVANYKATFICLVPFMFRTILQLSDLQSYDVSSLRSVFLTAANVPVEMKLQALDLFRGAQIIDGYGLTEMTSNVAMLKGKDVLERTASVGLEGTVTTVKIMNDALEEVGPGVVGEIAVSGPNVMKEYYKDPQATAEVIKGQWLLTGDLGRKDQDGYLYIVGRKKEMAIGGEEGV